MAIYCRVSQTITPKTTAIGVVAINSVRNVIQNANRRYRTSLQRRSATLSRAVVASS
jgi:hypothetical protein